MKSSYIVFFVLAASILPHYVRAQDEDDMEDEEDLDEFRDSLTWGRAFLDGGVSHHQYFKARFGGEIPTGHHPVVIADPIIGCGPLKNADAVKGALVVVERGECTYATKARSIQKAGGVGLLVYNHQDEGLIHPPGPDGADVTLPVVMITHEYGMLLKEVTSRQESKAQLLPIYCEKESGVSVCLPVTDQEKDAHAVTEGGSIVAGDLKAEYLTSKFGGPMPNTAVAAALADPITGCSEMDSAQLSGKIVVLCRGGCTFLTKISNTQRAGAAGAIVVNTQPGILRMDSLKRYESYNITIPTVMISTEKGDELQEKLAAGNVVIEFQKTGLKASVWDTLRNEVAAEQWPLEPEESKEMYLSLLKQHIDSDG